MANPEHLAQLDEGVEAWNQWRKRKENEHLDIDLSAAEPAVKDLTGADLHRVNLKEAKLPGAKLGHGTVLCDSDFSGAVLTGADLHDVIFTGADLCDAIMREAILQGADLSGTIRGLRTEQLAGSDLSLANWLG